ncbi:hypothetical protein COV17_01570 [Candidatus Woesearchaeota archaeon CG10_big_fil_rev_8_21_14_0_10_36_11]|nr:MAG: hypothetical protein COV17_01570 [Candidatus Woesearchaeota archaeon CG10_big_fil_rev_8_21_14_0_10_36_11]
MEGTVKFFNQKKGFGFVHGDDEKDYFVHFTALPQGVFLRDNDRVSFDPVEGDRGLKAENVQLLQKGSDRESTEDEQPEDKEAEEESDEEPEDESEEEEEPESE